MVDIPKIHATMNEIGNSLIFYPPFAGMIFADPGASAPHLAPQLITSSAAPHGQ
jgi:hypothetical protein